MVEMDWHITFTCQQIWLPLHDDNISQLWSLTNFTVIKLKIGSVSIRNSSPVNQDHRAESEIMETLSCCTSADQTTFAVRDSYISYKPTGILELNGRAFLMWDS